MQGDMYLISKGLKAGEHVVNGGLVKISAGQKVTPQMQKFEVPAQTEHVQPQAVDGNTVAKLDEEIEAAEAPDTEVLPQAAAEVAAAQTPAPAAQAAPVTPAQTATAPTAAAQAAPTGK